ncbi:MAG: cysteine desulfurase [Candidatus Odinarchaeota archaeon]|nr:cysteine desulfurase [Candidatus Odinarchaeota archaeon]
MSVRDLIAAHGTPPKEVYFDLENSGYVPDEVVKAMIPYFNKVGYGHPSITHKIGWEAYEVIYETKDLVRKTIGAKNIEEIIFTHSGTEANNLAIFGFALANRKNPSKIVISSIEHLSVIFPAEEAEKLFGFKILQLPVDEKGFVDPEILQAYIDKDVSLVSIQMVNHEIGTIQNIKELVKVVKDVNPNAIFHTDAADAYGKVKINVEEMGIDMLTISSHKIHGPRGVGLLYLKEGTKIEPVLRGQLSVEKYWPGVENVPLIVGFKKAVELAFDDFDGHIRKVRDLRDRLMSGIIERVPHVLVNGPEGDKRAPDNVNLSFLFVEGEAITVELSLRGIYVSSGSACTSRILEPSHVLLAIGRKHEEAHGSILFKLSRYHTKEDIDYTLENIPPAIERLRHISSWKPEKKSKGENNEISP